MYYYTCEVFPEDTAPHITGLEVETEIHTTFEELGRNVVNTSPHLRWYCCRRGYSIIALGAIRFISDRASFEFDCTFPHLGNDGMPMCMRSINNNMLKQRLEYCKKRKIKRVTSYCSHEVLAQYLECGFQVVEQYVSCTLVEMNMAYYNSDVFPEDKAPLDTGLGILPVGFVPKPELPEFLPDGIESVDNIHSTYKELGRSLVNTSPHLRWYRVIDGGTTVLGAIRFISVNHASFEFDCIIPNGKLEKIKNILKHKLKYCEKQNIKRVTAYFTNEALANEQNEHFSNYLLNKRGFQVVGQFVSCTEVELMLPRKPIYP